MAYKMVGYFENWAQWRGEGWDFKPDRIDPNLYTHINYAFADFGFISSGFPEKGGPKLTGDYKVLPHEWNDEDILYPALQKLKEKNPNLKTLISIGGWNFNDPNSPYSGQWTSELFSRMAASREHRQEFIESAIEYAQKHGFDGVDIDWEYPGDARQGGNIDGADDFANYLTLLAEFRQAIGGNNLLLTIAAPAIVTTGVPSNSPYKDPNKYFEWLGNCAQHLDWLNIMAYDYHGAFDPQTGVLAPLLEDSVPDGEYSVKNSVESYLKLAKIPPEKLVLGIPTYGRTFKVAQPLTESDNRPNKDISGPGAAGGATKEPGVLAYYEIAQRLSNNELKRVWHAPTYTPYAYSSATGEWVSYEDEDSVCYKTSYLMREGLSGAMVWAIALDDFKNGFPLQRKIKGILDNPGNGCPTTRPDDSSSQNPLTPYITKLLEDLDDLVDIVVIRRPLPTSPIPELPLPDEEELDDILITTDFPPSEADPIRETWPEILTDIRTYPNGPNGPVPPKIEKLIDIIDRELEETEEIPKYLWIYILLQILRVIIKVEEITRNRPSGGPTPGVPGVPGQPGGPGQPGDPDDNNNQDRTREKCENAVKDAVDAINDLNDKLEDYQEKLSDEDSELKELIDIVLHGNDGIENPTSPTEPDNPDNPDDPDENKHTYSVRLDFDREEEEFDDDLSTGSSIYISMTVEFYTLDKTQMLAKYRISDTGRGNTQLDNIIFRLGWWGHAEFNYEVEWLLQEEWAARLVVHTDEQFLEKMIANLFITRRKFLIDILSDDDESSSQEIPLLPRNVIRMDFQGREDEEIGNAIFTFRERYRGNILPALPRRNERFRRFSDP